MSSSTPWSADARPHRTASAGVSRARTPALGGVLVGAMYGANSGVLASTMVRLWGAMPVVMALALALCQPAAASTETLPEAQSQRERGAAEALTRSTAHPQLPGSRLRGEGKLRFFGLGIYQARLWTSSSFRADQALDHPVVLELTYLRDFEGGSIAQRSLDEMRRAGSLSEAQAQRWLAAMRRVFPDVRSGERVTGLHQPGQGVSFWIDGRPLGEIADPEFGRRFLGIWLSPSTSQPGLRLSLLGLATSGSL